MRPGVVTPFQMDIGAMANAEVARAQASLFRAQEADILGQTEEAKVRIAARQKEIDRMQSDIDLNVQKINESVAQVELMDEQRKVRLGIVFMLILRRLCVIRSLSEMRSTLLL